MTTFMTLLSLLTFIPQVKCFPNLFSAHVRFPVNGSDQGGLFEFYKPCNSLQGEGVQIPFIGIGSWNSSQRTRVTQENWTCSLLSEKSSGHLVSQESWG